MHSFCVIGLGSFGTAVAKTLAEEGKQVMVIDKSADRVTELADIVTHAVIGDATKPQVLTSAGVGSYECVVVALAENVNDNVLLAIQLKEMGIGKIVVRAQNDGHRHVLEHIGADVVVYAEKDMGERTAHKLAQENVKEYMELRGFQIVETEIPTAWVGKTLVDLAVRRKYGVNVIAVTEKDGKTDISPSPARPFSSGDSVTVLGDEKSVEKLMKEF